ncbi:hypothetical protein C8Q74DRAFT_1373473 [Fomes fomentarius]|nr:hypothetical protein C8Q74DRAFT_1373473 [Fomes fomentarius]
METISLSLLEGAPEHQSGLGLFLQPISDLPLACSPSPSEDDFGFLDVQLDPDSANVDVDEFLALRALRKHALAQERAARRAEADLSQPLPAERIVQLRTDGTSSTRASVSAVWGPKPLENLVGLQVRSAVEVEAAILRRRLGTAREDGRARRDGWYGDGEVVDEV